MKPADLKLLALFLVLAATILLRVVVEATGYRTPDSLYYLEAAQNLLQGRGLTMSNEYPIPALRTETNQVPFTAWPVGYPVLIAAVSLLTSLPVFWASKLVNVLLLGACLLLLRLFSKQKAWLLGLIFCSFTMLEIFSYTWSEGPFLFFLLLFCLSLSRLLAGTEKPVWWLWLLLSAVGLFLIRYIGMLAVPLIGLAAVWQFFAGHKPKAGKLLAVGFAAGIFVLGYFYFNYLRTGSMWGGTRVFPHNETPAHFLFILFRGLMNEFFIVRNYYFRGPVETLFLITSAIQLAWMGLFWHYCLRGRVSWSFLWQGLTTRILFCVAGAYLAFLIVLRLLSPFDAFDYRLLSPFTLLVFTGLSLVLSNPAQPVPQRRYEWFLTLFFLFSLLMNLPKEYLLQLVF